MVQAAARLVLEPIFEADFQPCSYGFRPKKDAHQAVEEIRTALAWGYTQVLDADLTAYFDSIPHDQLLAAVARRVADRHILRLLTQWLRAPVMIERADGKREREAAHGPVAGPRRVGGSPRCSRTSTCTPSIRRGERAGWSAAGRPGSSGTPMTS